MSNSLDDSFEDEVLFALPICFLANPTECAYRHPLSRVPGAPIPLHCLTATASPPFQSGVGCCGIFYNKKILAPIGMSRNALPWWGGHRQWSRMPVLATKFQVTLESGLKVQLTGGNSFKRDALQKREKKLILLLTETFRFVILLL